jgi:hypothetical protein
MLALVLVGVVDARKLDELLTEIRNPLKPLSLLDDPSIVRRVKEEIAKGSQGNQSLAIAR